MVDDTNAPVLRLEHLKRKEAQLSVVAVPVEAGAGGAVRLDERGAEAMLLRGGHGAVHEETDDVVATGDPRRAWRHRKRDVVVQERNDCVEIALLPSAHVA